RILWKGLLVSPAVLAASLVVSSTALAAEQPVEIAAAAQADQLQLAGAATEVAKSETAKPETAEPASLASKSTVETIEKESANLYEGFTNDLIAPVAEQAKAPEVAAADLGETKSAVAPANLSPEQPVAEQIPAVAPANLSETQPSVA
ncbi:porin, partial [Microcoleus sp. HI-ES]|nr:porin [Microcoleus sp. HI-ES]